MNCTACGGANAPGMKFCGQCGAKLGSGCPSCGFVNPESFRFCGQCGQGLSSSENRTAEHRFLTVVFCDLVGSTELSGSLELEALRDVVRRYQAACSEPVERFGGHIAQLLGDGVLVYFGYPTAHEDDAQRAVHAALGIVQSVHRLADELLPRIGSRLDVRVAVHTGPVVAGEMGTSSHRENLALGHTPNVAARIQGLVEPGTVGVSDSTYQLTRGFFEFEELGERQLKGVAEPIVIYRPLLSTGVRSRFELTARAGLIPMVGRKDELSALIGAFDAACSGESRVVLVVGEAGMGKSRLVHEFLESTSDRPHSRFVGRCSPYHQLSAFYPVIDVVRDALHISEDDAPEASEDDAPEAQLDQLEAGLSGLDLPLQTYVPVFADFLSIPLGTRYPPLGLLPHKVKERTLEALTTIILRLSESKPVVLVVEDMHWADASTLELLGLIVRRWHGAPITTVVTTRPEASPPWGLVPHLTMLSLQRLSDDEARTLVRSRSARDIPKDVLAEVVARTDGIPLFVEEVTEMLSEGGRVKSSIPTSLHAALTARLDRGEWAKKLAQIGSVFGREFTREMVRSVTTLPEDALEHELDDLVEANLLTQRGSQPRITYSFRHALIRDAAYGSMLKATRQKYHRSAAQFLAEVVPESLDTHPEVIANHWTEGDRSDLAVPLWLKAGQRALRSGNVESVAHLRRGLDLLSAWPAGPGRDAMELGLQCTLGPALSTFHGYAAPPVQDAYARALELCRTVGETQGLFWVMRGLTAYYFVKADIERGAGISRELLAMANPAVVSEVMDGHYTVGLVDTFRGDFTSGRDHLELAVSLDSPDRDRSSMLFTGLDVGVISCCIASMPAWALGYQDRALAHANRAIELAEAIGHPLSHACALYHAALVHVFRGEHRLARDRANQTVQLAAELGFFFDQLGVILLGWGDELSGEDRALDDPLAAMETALVNYRSTGSCAAQTFYLALIVEVCLHRDDIPRATRYLEEGLQLVASTGERYWEAELHRLAGEIALRRAGGLVHHLEAERSYLRALETAQSQRAVSLELRAAVALARLWTSQRRLPEARKLLESALDALPEGQDTSDARAALELLDALHPGSGGGRSHDRPSTQPSTRRDDDESDPRGSSPNH